MYSYIPALLLREVANNNQTKLPVGGSDLTNSKAVVKQCIRELSLLEEVLPEFQVLLYLTLIGKHTCREKVAQ